MHMDRAAPVPTQEYPDTKAARHRVRVTGLIHLARGEP